MSMRRSLLRLRRDERGTTIVELAFCVAVFLLLFFAILDFGRMSYNWVMAEKAMQMAARIAAVRPPACPGVPTTNQRGSSGTAFSFGTSCNSASNICQGESLNPFSCSGTTASATADEIWGRIRPLLPNNATRANLQFTYSYDRDMNFLGGPYVPVITVELRNLDFAFTSPLWGLARTAGAVVNQPGNTPAAVSIPSMSVSLPGEDLAQGMDG